VSYKEINGVRLGVEERRASTSTITLVLLHGFTGSASGWGELLNTFAQDGMRVIALDMLGHGQSDAPTDVQRYSMEHCRADILAIMQECGVKHGEAVLLGYSMGGRIALYTALSGFFRAIILESASPGIADACERAQRRQSDEALAARIEREGVPAFVDYWEGIPLFASQRALPQEVRQALRTQRLQNSAFGLAQSLRGVGTGVQPFLGAELAMLSLPVLLIAGELDSKFSALAHTMAQHLPDATVRIVARAGHAVHLEQSAHFQHLVRTFCTSSTKLTEEKTTCL
jgi:2-succinyl-6-hydroxy-2,4-cyclohexadiene-1-carboxylate synthase